VDRQVLVQALRRQYQQTDATLATLTNLESLSKPNAFTVTTGHQLNLFTGPLYFLYKIVSVINLAKELSSAYPDSIFVPMYWMATEDHDFEEISYFNFNGKKFRWNREASGPVGRLSTDGLDAVLRLFENELGASQHAKEIAELFREAYIRRTNLTESTRWLANKLFGEYGLVIVDGDDPDLKRGFIPYMKDDIENSTAYETVSATIANMGDYNIQVNPREINLFYVSDGLRERIVSENDGFRIFGTEMFFTKTELLDQLQTNPERFSPNVIMRPLYQEVILPNLSYTGGGGEIAYWLELKSFFETQQVPFPILMVRNSVVMVSEKQQKKRQALDLSW
ncbi:MAG: bacillithiol biosynthesis cysteine-adding enzyme BshC, partial [Chitinophagaceae bacterium]